MKKQNRFETVMKSARGQMRSLFVLSFLANILLLTSSIYMLQIFNRVLASGSVSTLIWLTLLAVVAIAVYGFMEQARRLILARIGSWIDNEISPFVIKHAIDSKLASGTVKANLNDVSDVRAFLGSDAILTFLDAPWMPVFIAIIWLIHPVLGVIALCGAIFLFGLALINNAATRRRQAESRLNMRDARNAAMQYIDNAETVSALGMTHALITRWFRKQAAFNEESSRTIDTTALLSNISRASRLALQIIILGAGAWLVLNTEATPGGMIAASIILSRALSPVERSITAWRSYGSYRVARSRLSSLFNSAKPREGSFDLPKPKGDLKVDSVHFVPPGAGEAVLKQVDLKLQPGEVCGIIGPSGAGKTTLCRLITGVWKPSFGTVWLDGADVSVWDSEKLGPNIGYLPQQIELFDGTVAENIARMGNASDEEVIAAARLAGAHEMILKLPNAYETEVGVHGAYLSGGQKQRIGLARALLREPPLIILDEPALNLDAEGEMQLIKAIAELKKRGHTMVVVAHQPKILRSADKILLLRDGLVHAFGPRDEVFRSLMAVQGGKSDTPAGSIQVGAAE